MSGYDYAEPSTSSSRKTADDKPSILVQKSVRGPFGSNYIRPIKAGPFRAKYPPKKKKKILNFLNNSSSDSIVTVLNGKKWRRTRYSNRRYLPSGDRRSDCYIEVSFENCGLRFTRGGEPQSYREALKCFKRTRCCKILICFICGFVLPTFIIFMVLLVSGI
ncbi:uncharacterized protein [Fopius arisanus]|uniref:Uncharacterized protein n=1 Tax=Fopius arisanus TaxID=64838 RepID=A0A9R1U277_9HYME|nr:PREDICTED: uncharacterized protein LOC105268454 [Fopius arisanus]XP_011306327.1 PREDICTED: uncharacterized protein LOC105268454 [Fopius arisanus]